MPVPLTVIGGYLGSGKTTLINRVLSSPDAGRVAVVVNDFGDVNIDAALVAARGADTLELTNGCICCLVTDDVQRTMSGLAARDDLEHVMCEVSGIGDPSQLGTWRTYPGFRPGPTIVCADALTTPRRARDEYVGDVVRRQLAAADIILVTKGDLAEPAQIEGTQDVCRRINPGADIQVSSSGDPTAVSEAIRRWAAADEDVGARPDEARADPPPHADVHSTETVRLAVGVPAESVTSVLTAHAHLLVRAKGFVQRADGAWLQVHLAGGTATTAPAPARPHAEVVLISAGPQAARSLSTVAQALRTLPADDTSPTRQTDSTRRHPWT
ncbi:CobW family GTP-binding protein [Brevibacterium jeotgali]|uniref:GTPase, G3E family n=1 Tax=Brevibacterium jeotgali TaxID=1262550 RepID=A0A2H1L5I3_9MICO|nr:GTP-binding protein [Brevibacterium jeotgali]TWB98537.1 G3E family GTPase [Brevibacterium jeotgali]SMY12010.1 GTPase, G3E family [Brevibacterium jeotgali]